MNAYTISKLARDSGFSAAVVHNYTQRGLLRPARCTPSGYRIYDIEALERLRLIQAGRKAGIPLAELEAICRALNEHDGVRLARSITAARSRITEVRAALDAFDGVLAALNRLPSAPNRERPPKVRGAVLTTHAI
ncbi:MAG: mercuric resistance transcriptional repressor protein MerD [Betaproteobacteria bacterium RIFCSPLOWO2_12_FULL_62_13]|nr:MAG: mercuric resistance transcriptional repressor protein MerD [Betaproteobacteria bacterium RIFCSPLOWO2_12_FULL_62_13]